MIRSCSRLLKARAVRVGGCLSGGQGRAGQLVQRGVAVFGRLGVHQQGDLVGQAAQTARSGRAPARAPWGPRPGRCGRHRASSGGSAGPRCRPAPARPRRCRASGPAGRRTRPARSGRGAAGPRGSASRRVWWRRPPRHWGSGFRRRASAATRSLQAMCRPYSTIRFRPLHTSTGPIMGAGARMAASRTAIRPRAGHRGADQPHVDHQTAVAGEAVDAGPLQRRQQGHRPERERQNCGQGRAQQAGGTGGGGAQQGQGDHRKAVDGAEPVSGQTRGMALTRVQPHLGPEGARAGRGRQPCPLHAPRRPRPGPEARRRRGSRARPRRARRLVWSGSRTWRPFWSGRHPTIPPWISR